MEINPQHTQDQRTLAGLDFVTWHLLGYEEFIAGYNDLLQRRLLVVLEQYLDVLNTLLFEYQVTTRQRCNPWYLEGVLNGLDYTEQCPALTTLPNYRDYTGCYFAYQFAGVCDYCSRRFEAGQGCVAQDMIQDAAFCTRECAVHHRKDLFQMIPQLQQFYKPQGRQVGRGPHPTIQVHEDWYLRPLPYTEQKLREYFCNLPAPDLNELQPIHWQQWQPKAFTPRLKSPLP